MAGGIDWLRWHHGTVTDQKFPLIARRAGASVAEALAVWACVLEAASQHAEERGKLPALPDFEAMDCALGMVEGRAKAIFGAMTDRGLIDEWLQLTAWNRRQPRRERDEAGASTARVQAHRARQRASKNSKNGAAGNASETPRNAGNVSETPRVEEREITPIGVSSPTEIQHLVDDGVADGRPDPIPDCPHLKILALFAEKVPSLPQPMFELWDGAKAVNLRKRWRWVLTSTRSSGPRAGQRYATNEQEALGFFARFFGYVEASDFLTGRDARNWQGCSLEWLVKPTNFGKVLQGNYENAGTPQQPVAGAAVASPPGYTDITAKLDADAARQAAVPPERALALASRARQSTKAPA